MSIHSSQKKIRLKLMNSSLNSFLEWKKLLDIHEIDLDLKKNNKKFSKMTKKWNKKLFSLRFNSMNSLMIFTKKSNSKNEWFTENL